jgi:hypothetical protein
MEKKTKLYSCGAIAILLLIRQKLPKEILK